MKKIIRNFLSACALAATTAAHAHSGIPIFATDFDGGGNQTTSYGYTFAGGSSGGASVNAASGWTGDITAGVGVSGSSAYLGHPDFTATGSDPLYTNASSYTYSGANIHLEFGAPINPLTPSAHVDSYHLSFLARVEGLKPGITSTTILFDQLTLQTNGVAWLKFKGGSFTVNSNFSHFESLLSALTLDTGSLNDLTNSALLATVTGFVTDLRVIEETGTLLVDRSPVWGLDNDNILIVDDLQFSQTANTVVPPQQEKLIWEVNFDDQPPGNSYGFFFRDGTNTAVITPAFNATAGVGGSAALEVTADISSWAGAPPTSFSGFGPGVGKAVPYTLTNTNKSAYMIQWTAKAGGFLPGVTSASGNASIQFLVPDGTLGATNGQADVVLELAPTITLSSNLTAFVFDGATAPIGLYNGGSQAMFNQYISQVNLIQVQAQFNGSPDIGTLFGYDADNTMTVDNIKVVEFVPATPALNATNAAGQVKIHWTDPASGGTAKLQHATNAAGPYLDVAGATSAAASPYTVPAGGARQFYRTEWVP